MGIYGADSHICLWSELHESRWCSIDIGQGLPLIRSVVWEVEAVVERHSPFECPCWIYCVEDESHWMAGMNHPGIGHASTYQRFDCSVNHCRICDGFIILIGDQGGIGRNGSRLCMTTTLRTSGSVAFCICVNVGHGADEMKNGSGKVVGNVTIASCPIDV